MARIRSIKPQFFLNEDVAALPFQWRLLFIGLWTQADREGRLEDRPVRLKAMIFPYDDLDVSDGLGCLVNAGLITRYEGQGLRLISIPTWARHQQPNIKEQESELPPPFTEKHGASTVQALQERKGAGAGKEQEGNGSAQREAFDQFWAVYPRKTAKDAALAVWMRLKPDLDTVVSAVKAQLKGWDDPKFIPHARTWLSQKRWKDEAETVRQETAEQPDIYGHFPRCTSWKECVAKALAEAKAGKLE